MDNPAEIAWVVGVFVTVFGITYWSSGLLITKVSTGVRIVVGVLAGLFAGVAFYMEI